MDAEQYELYVENIPFLAPGAPVARRLLEEFKGPNLDGHTLGLTQFELLRLESGVVFLDVWDKKYGQSVLRTRWDKVRFVFWCCDISVLFLFEIRFVWNKLDYVMKCIGNVEGWNYWGGGCRIDLLFYDSVFSIFLLKKKIMKFNYVREIVISSFWTRNCSNLSSWRTPFPFAFAIK